MQTMSPPTDRPILVVDDDVKIVRLVRMYLERAGYRVIEATDGRSALAAIADRGAGPRRPRHHAARRSTASRSCGPSGGPTRRR